MHKASPMVYELMLSFAKKEVKLSRDSFNNNKT